MAEMKSNSVPITVSGKKQLEEELKRLVTVDRPNVIKAIEEARAHGDLKENAEYAAAKEKQGFIEGRIQYLNSVVATAQVIDPKAIKFEHVVFGATVHLEDADSGAKVTYQIVGVDEANIAGGKISVASPIARALIGKNEGDEVQVNTPKGSMTYEIRGIEYK